MLMKTKSLFEDAPKKSRLEPKEDSPLAERMRPLILDDVLGQEELLGKGKPLREAIEQDSLQSLILWGPPGTGKTTIARIIATVTRAKFVSFSAVLSGVRDIKEVTSAATTLREVNQQRTIVFVDEIHRFNKAQQDAFLPHVETGNIILIGATTENPSFEVNAALLSRSRVFFLKPLQNSDIKSLLNRAISDPKKGLKKQFISFEHEALSAIANFSNGDARTALNVLEFSAASIPFRKDQRPVLINLEKVNSILQRRSLLYDKNGEEHYNLISALHKSMRNSDPQASVYWLARMLESGEDPLYISRRLVRFASEDVGNADPQALVLTISVKDAVNFIGMPECSNALAQAVIYLAIAPKSNAVYRAYEEASKDVHQVTAEPVPLHLRNPTTGLMKKLKYGEGYQYAHSNPDATTDMECLPSSLIGRKYYQPTKRGFEGEIRKRLQRKDP